MGRLLTTIQLSTPKQQVQEEEDPGIHLRGLVEGYDHTHTVRELTEPCIVVITHMQFEDHHEEEHIECELQGGDRISGQDQLFQIKNLPVGFRLSPNVRSGTTTLYASSAKVIDELGVLFIPSAAAIEMVSHFPWFDALVPHTLLLKSYPVVSVPFLRMILVPTCVVSLLRLATEMCW